MKKIFVEKPEPLLLFVPLILFLLSKIFTGVMALDISILFWGVFAFVIVPFLLHSLLRVSGKWNPVFCRPHVYVTILLLMILFVFYTNIQYGQPLQRNGIYSVAGRFTGAWNHSKLFTLIFLIELMVQFLFTIYFLIRIFQKSYTEIYRRPKPFIG